MIKWKLMLTKVRVRIYHNLVIQLYNFNRFIIKKESYYVL